MPRYNKSELIQCGAAILNAAGMEETKAVCTATLLLEADMCGHITHGFQLLGPYVKTLESGDMIPDGEPEVILDSGGTFYWDGKFLPGLWLTDRAVKELITRVSNHGVATAVIRQSSHIGSLQVYLQQATDRGYLIFLNCSDPSAASIAPYGGTTAVYTPNPIAMGIPTGGDPILIDTSLSICSNGQTMRAAAEGRSMPGKWILDADGCPTDDPNALFGDAPGTILPVGGADHGFKGFGFALMAEALTQGLGNYNRKDGSDRWGCSTFIQVIDPELFGGREALETQSSYLVQQCLASTPQPDYGPVRIPGHNALKRKRDAVENGVPLELVVVEGLEKWGARLNVDVPQALEP